MVLLLMVKVEIRYRNITAEAVALKKFHLFPLVRQRGRTLSFWSDRAIDA
jgi:hypothetical protein